MLCSNLLVLLATSTSALISAFTIPQQSISRYARTTYYDRRRTGVYNRIDDEQDNDEEGKDVNPYADPNYPEVSTSFFGPIFLFFTFKFESLIFLFQLSHQLRVA